VRLIRYRKGGTEPILGCLEDEVVHRLEGNPLRRPRRGPRVDTVDNVELIAPCAPAKVVAMAINFLGVEGWSEEMREPMVFVKPSTTVCGPGDIVVNPFPELPWWGEAELAVVIASRLRNASRDEAERAVLGFTVGNDTTVENVDGRDHHLARSKCADGFCALGPWIDTQFDASDCVIEAVQNGEVIRRGRSSEQIWQWPQTLAWLSSWMTLEPWDVVLTGNPPDTVGMRYLADGDVYTARVQGLGELTNHFSLREPPCV
jgi:2-keto-4-pentenoate hydratase/2-oxohepta-3-ene-1,7-dioic acid hydratase in catechol pathway